jgi:superfamily II DNA or RNA helicase
MSSSALPSTEDLRRPQRECLDVLYETWGDDEVGDEVYCQLWCGVGKTLVYFVAMSQLEIERVMLVVPSLELVRQVRRDYLETFGLLDEWDIVCSEPGSEFVSAVDFDGNENRHVLTTYASLPKLAEQAFDLVIYDEAHHLKDEGRHANTMVSWYFSATLPVEYQEILHYRYDFCDAIRDGFAQDFCIEVFVRPKSEEVDLPTLLHGLAEETGNQKLLVFTRFAQTDDRSVVAWVDENAGKIKDLGGWCKSLVGTTPTAQRAMILGEFESREGWSVVASCKVLAEGVDTKGADSLLFADPKSSYVDILQNVGRVTRRKKHDRPASIIVPIFVDPDKYR